MIAQSYVRRWAIIALVLTTVCGGGLPAGPWRLGPAWAQAEDAAPAPPVDLQREDDPREELYARFRQTLTGATLAGHFVEDGQQPPQLAAEQYEIRSVSGPQDGDYWVLQTRIRYGQKDVTLPVPVPVKWAGDTPVITLDNLTIPGLGTFTARVVLSLSDRRYAGTWTHGDKGGHLFGRIVADTGSSPPSEAEPVPAAEGQ
jgi:hypothetical protein